MTTAATSPSRKEALLEVAANLFYEQGYNATGIKQIIDEAGIAKGTFYSHFKSKEDLGVAWLQQRHLLWNSWRDAYLAEHANTPYEKILALFDYIKKWMDESNCRGCAFLNTMAEVPDFNSPMREEVRIHKRDLLNFVRSLVDAHLMTKANSEKRQHIARTLFLLMESSIVEYQNFREDWTVACAKKAARTTLINCPIQKPLFFALFRPTGRLPFNK